MVSIGDRPGVVHLRAFDPRHVELLRGWLQAPHVARWYRQPADDLAWAAHPPEKGGQAIICSGSAEIGYLRWQRVDRETLDSLGLFEIPENSVDADILIGTTGETGRGLGVAALQALVADVGRDSTVPMIGLTTEVENTRAHRAFEKAGFSIRRQYDTPPLGLCHLMIRDLDLQ